MKDMPNGHARLDIHSGAWAEKVRLPPQTAAP